MTTVGSDVRFAVRRLRMAPAFTTFAVVSLALGLGVSTAVYSAVRTLFWMPVGIQEPGRVWSWTAAGRFVPSVSWPDFLDIRGQQSSFGALAASRRMTAAVSIGSAIETVFAEGVSGEYFEALGLRRSTPSLASRPTPTRSCSRGEATRRCSFRLRNDTGRC